VCGRSKKRNTETLKREHTSNEIAFVTKTNLKVEGEGSASKLINEAIFATPTRAENISARGKRHRPVSQLNPIRKTKPYRYLWKLN